jgi:hypothetical protein
LLLLLLLFLLLLLLLLPLLATYRSIGEESELRELPLHH